MEIILLTMTLAFIITFTAIPVIINVSKIKKLYDLPNARKIHARPIPSLGGLGIFAGFIIACLMTIPLKSASGFQYFFAASLVIFFLGLKDDILILTPMKKIIGQAIAAFIIIYKGGIVINSMHGFLGVHEMPEMIGMALTYLTVIVIINSFNLIDGVDGLAGGLGIFTTMVFGVYFYLVGEVHYATLGLAMSGSLLAFLIFNRSPARIFMGDTGSLLIGLINAILAIHFINIADDPGTILKLNAPPAIAISLLIIPLFDTLRVFAIRIFNRRSPFSPDRNHIHHILLDRGMSHTAVCLSLVMANILFVTIAYLLNPLNINLIIPILLSIAFGAFALVYFTKPKIIVVVKTETSDIIHLANGSQILPLTAAPKAAEQN